MFGAAGDMGSAFLLVCLSIILVIISAFPVIRLIGWWIDGGIEPLLAIIGIAFYVLLIVAAMSTGSMAMALLIFSFIIASAILTPVVGQMSEHKQLTDIDDERMNQYALALESNPQDPVARIAFAEALHKKGELARAIEHLQWAHERFPGLATRIKPQLDSWLRERDRAGWQKPVICHLCHAENDPGATFCEKCGAQFGTKTAIRERIRKEGGPKVVIRGWIVSASVLMVISLVVLAGLSSIVAGPIIVASITVGAWLFLRWVGGDMGTIGD